MSMPQGLKLAFTSQKAAHPQAAPSTCVAECSQQSTAGHQSGRASQEDCNSDDDLIASMDVGALLLDASAAGARARTTPPRPTGQELAGCFGMAASIRASSALQACGFVLRGLPVRCEAQPHARSLLWLLCCSQDAALRGIPGVQNVHDTLCTVPILLDACWTVPDWSLRRACVHIVMTRACSPQQPKPTYMTQVGEVLHINGDFGLLVVHPEKLLSPSTLVSGMDCERRPVLKSMLPGGSQSPAALKGTIKHELFEALVESAAASPPPSVGDIEDALLFLAADAADLARTLASAPSALLAAEECDITPQQLHSSLEACIPSILSFIEQHVFRGAGSWALRRVVQAEEDMHCAVLGLKGIVDMVVVLGLKDGSEVCVPLELKTGAVPKSMRPSHRAQVALYSLLLASTKAAALNSDTLHTGSVTFNFPGAGPAASGLLLHLHSDGGGGFQVDAVPHSWQEIKSLMQLRNRMAATFHPLFPQLNAFGVPSRNVPPSVCEMCFDRESCDKLFACEAASPVQLQQLKVTVQWKDVSEYVQHFWGLLQLEQAASEARTARAGGQALPPLLSDTPTQLAIRSVLSTSESSFSVVFDVLTGEGGQVRCGDMVQLCLAARPTSSMLRAVVETCSDNIMRLRVFQDPRRTISLLSELTGICSSACGAQAPVAWRLHRQAFASGSRVARGALLQLATQTTCGLFPVLSGLKAPTFRAEAPGGAAGAGCEAFLQGLNPEQCRAVRMCQRAETLAIIQGMPGAGKSTTTTALCLCLLAQGKRLLLASHTNAAVDGLLSKLANLQDFHKYSGMRLGQPNKVESSLRMFCAGGSAACSSLASAAWVASTAHTAGACSSIGHFDVVIIDEASQLMEPATLALALLGSAFVLVGDHMQIAPLVHSEPAQGAGLGVSMMQRMAETWPHCLTKLCTQYRMTEGLQVVSNSFMYAGEMVCGLPRAPPGAVQEAPPPHDAQGMLQATTAFEDAMQDGAREVVFVDVPATGKHCKSSLHECTLGASALVHAVSQMLTAGRQPSSIAIICALRKHVEFYKRVFPAQLAPRVGTIDTFQGQEADVVLVDGFESKPSLLLDARRMNVACTRSKQKLVLFCHSACLWQGPLAVLRSRADQHWLLPLPSPFASKASQVCEIIENGGVPPSAAWGKLVQQARLSESTLVHSGDQRSPKMGKREK